MERRVLLGLGLAVILPLSQAFRCDGGLFGGRNLPDSFVNDDYCDCADLSDEPATNACALLTKVAKPGGTIIPMFSCRDTKG